MCLQQALVYDWNHNLKPVYRSPVLKNEEQKIAGKKVTKGHCLCSNHESGTNIGKAAGVVWKNLP